MPRAKKRESTGGSNKSNKKRRTISHSSAESGTNCEVVNILGEIFNKINCAR